MRHAALAALILPSIALVLPTAALAGERGPACRVPTVVEEITREVRAQSYYATVDPRLITETATPALNLVRCDVCVEQAPYLQTRASDPPVRTCVPHSFELRIAPSGFIVRDLH